MNYKEEIIRNVACKMANILTIEQLQELENELAKALYQYDVTLAECFLICHRKNRKGKNGIIRI